VCNVWCLEMSKIGAEVQRLMGISVYAECPECGGAGKYEVDVPMPHNAGRDVGYLDSEWVTCDECGGEGQVEKTCTDCGEVMSAWDTNENDIETVCFECRHNR